MTLTDFLLARIAEDEARVEGFWQGEDPDFYWGPDRIRAECEAKRRIVEMCSWADWTDSATSRLADLEGTAQQDVLALLALPYADRPGYDEEWRP